MSDLQIFNYGSNKIRTIMINGQPWFVLKDVCLVLGLSNSRKVAERLDEDEKGVTQIYTPGGPQEMTIINESGLYAVILRSDKPEAKPFRKWVTTDVLPTIRRTGSYGQLGAPTILWSSQEFEQILCACLEIGREDYITALYLVRYAALEPQEIFDIDADTAALAVKDRRLMMNCPGNATRAIPLNDLLVARIRTSLVNCGRKLLVPDGVWVCKAVKDFQTFFYHNVFMMRRQRPDRALTFDGLRQTCIAEWYGQFTSLASTPEPATLPAAEAGPKLLTGEREPRSPRWPLRPLSFDDIPLVLTVEELMPILCIGRNTAFALVRSGQIKSIRAGKQIRILKHELLEYLTGGTGTNAPWTDAAAPLTMEGDSCRAAEGGINNAAR